MQQEILFEKCIRDTHFLVVLFIKLFKVNFLLVHGGLECIQKETKNLSRFRVKLLVTYKLLLKMKIQVAVTILILVIMLLLKSS